MRHVVVLVAVTISLSTLAGCGGGEPASTRAAPSATPADEPTANPSAAEFDVEAWRREAIGRFGEETRYRDGSQLDYVEVARQICALEHRPEYDEDSLQDYIVETFCPNV